MLQKSFPPFHKAAIIIAVAFLFVARSVYGLGDQFLDTCLKIGENRDKKLTVAKEQIGLAKVRVLRAGRSFLPVFQFQHKYARGETVATGPYEEEDIGLQFSQAVFEGGRLTATYRYERLSFAIAELNYTKFREELFYKVKTAYYELLTANVERKKLKNTYEEIKKLEAKSQIEYNAKAISELDLQEAKIFSEKVQNMYKAAELSASLAEQKLIKLLNINTLDDIIFPLPEGLVEYPPEITFTLEECRRFVLTNNVEVKIADTSILVYEQKKKVDRAKVIPKLTVEGFYGQSGEAYAAVPMDLATNWSVMGKMHWSLWGNSLEMNQNESKMLPRQIMDESAKQNTNSFEVKFGLFDDLNYFVESRESAVSYNQAQAESHEILDKGLLELEKFYGEYKKSLWDARTAKDESVVKARKLDVARKKNELYETTTLEVMDGIYRYAEAVNAYTKALSTNYLAVCEMEKLTLMPLR